MNLFLSATISEHLEDLNDGLKDKYKLYAIIENGKCFIPAIRNSEGFLYNIFDENGKTLFDANWRIWNLIKI